MNKNTTTKKSTAKNTTKKGPKPMSEETLKSATEEQPVTKTEEIATETQTEEVATSEEETVVTTEEQLAPVFPPEELATETIPEPPVPDTGVTVLKFDEPTPLPPPPPAVKKEATKAHVQNDISISVQIKNENILVFKGYMKLSEIVKTLTISEKSTVTVQNKIVAAQIVELAKLANPERVIVKR